MIDDRYQRHWTCLRLYRQTGSTTYLDMLRMMPPAGPLVEARRQEVLRNAAA